MRSEGSTYERALLTSGRRGRAVRVLVVDDYPDNV